MKVLGTGGIAASGYGLLNDVSVPLFGVPLTVIGMAAAGAYLSFAYGKPEKVRKKLYGLALANTFLACVCVAVLPSALGWEWANTRLEAPLSGLFAFGARWWVPAFIESVPQWIQRILKIGDYKDTQKRQDYEEPVEETKE